MRLLVLSDCHHKLGPVYKVLTLHVHVPHVFFLGDGLAEFKQVIHRFPDSRFHMVKGNCDFCGGDVEDTALIAGQRIFYTHGHFYGVKAGRQRIIDAARGKKANIALFGHTHLAYTDYIDGIHIMNPGALSRPKNGTLSYGIIDITDGGVAMHTTGAGL